MTKLRSSAPDALRDVIEDGMTIAVGGFGLSGNPFDLIEALRDTGARDLTIVSNNMGVDGSGLGLLLESQQVRKVIASYVGREQAVRPAVPGRRARGRVRSRRARSPSGCGRAGPASRPSTRATGVGTPVARGQAARPSSTAGTTCSSAPSSPTSRLVQRTRADPAGNLAYRLHRAQLQPAGRHCRADDHRRGRDHPRRRLHRSRLRRHPGHLRAPVVQADAGARSRSSSARSGRASGCRRPDMWTRDEMAAHRRR